MTFTYLVILKGQEIALFRIHNNILENRRKEGKQFFDATEDFWEWWENSVEYMQGDIVDMAFVWDTPSPLMTESEFYEPLKKDTQWNQEIILEALSLVGLENLQLLQGNCEADQKNALFTNIEITSESIVPRNSRKKLNPKEIEIPEKRAQETESQKYYREMIEKEERERQNKFNEKSHTYNQ